MKKRSFLSISLSFLLIISFALINLNCGDGKTSHKVNIPKEPKKSTCEPGKWGGTLKLGISGTPLTFNPFISPTPETYEVTSKLFGTLIDYDNVNQKAQNDGMARSIDKADNNSYIIYLREGLAFSNGVPITAEDVMFSIKATWDPRLNSIFGDLIKLDGKAPELTKVNQLAVKITFPDAYEPIKELLSRIPIVSKKAMEDYFLKSDPKTAYGLDTPPEKIVSSGPFVLKSYSDKEIVLAYNPYYWKTDNVGTALPYLDGITYSLKVSRQEQQNNLLTKGDYHIAQLIQAQKSSFEGNDRFVIKDAGPSIAVWQLVLNWRTEQTQHDRTKATWFRTPNFRRAMSSLIERDKIATEVFSGMARPAYGVIAPENKLWFNPEAKKNIYDVKAAQNFLGTAKFATGTNNNLRDSNGNNIRFNLLHLNEFVPQQIANRLVDDLKKVGIQVEPDQVDYRKFWGYVSNGLFETALVESTPLLPDPAFMQPYLSKSGKFLYFDDPSEVNLSNTGTQDNNWLAQAARGLNDALKKQSLKERQEIYNKIQADWADNFPIIYLTNENVLAAAQKNLSNFKPAPIVPFLTWNAEEFYFKQ
jgi:peptide/nickel transport system substrate-binding protein